jgi:hypothetical protein
MENGKIICKMVGVLIFGLRLKVKVASTSVIDMKENLKMVKEMVWASSIMPMVPNI